MSMFDGTKTVRGVAAALALGLISGPAISRAQDQPNSPIAASVSTSILSKELAQDLKQFAAQKDGAYLISDQRAGTIKAELASLTGRQVDSINTYNGSAVLHNVAQSRDQVMFASGGDKLTLIISGPDAGKVEYQPATLDPVNYTSVFPEQKIQTSLAATQSISQSSHIWLKVFEAANEVLKSTYQGFSGKWRFSQDPLGIAAKVPDAARHLGAVTNIDGYSLESVAGIGDEGVTKVNNFFEKHGLGSRLTGGSSTGIAAAAIEKIKFLFVLEGKDTTIKIDGKTYKAVKKTDPIFYSSELSTEPIVELPTTNGVGLYLVKASGLPQAPTAADVLSVSEKLVASLQAAPGQKAQYLAGVVFPEIKFHSTTKPAWVIGATAEGLPEKVTQTALETIFEINRFGGSSLTGAAILTSRSAGGPKAYYFDGPVIAITVDKRNPTTVLNASLVSADACTEIPK